MNKERKETANKGFSLVELIIVVAIMAVLVGVLAPQYIKYVEKSRVSADATTTDEFVRAMQILASDVDVTLDATKEYKVSSASGAITISTALKDAFDAASSVDTSKTYTYKSTSYKAATVEIVLDYSSSTKMWTVTTTGQP